MEKQIIIKGNANKIPEKESDDYFNSRPFGSKIGAIVSKQSEVVENRESLEIKFREANDFYNMIKPKRPRDWGGYLVKPVLFEFWQGRKNRLHDRLEFIFESNAWNSNGLSP